MERIATFGLIPILKTKSAPTLEIRRVPSSADILKPGRLFHPGFSTAAQTKKPALSGSARIRSESHPDTNQSFVPVRTKTFFSLDRLQIRYKIGE